MHRVADGVFEIRLGFVRAHLVVTDDGVVLVDTGTPGRADAVQQAIGEARRSVGDVRAILLTHRHGDHTGGAAELARRSGARVVAHAADAPAVTGRTPAPARGVFRLLSRVLPDPEPVPVDETLTADGPFSVPDFVAVHTPGHTAGHVSFLLDRAGGVLFTGDVATSGRNGRVRRPPRVITEDVAATDASIRRLAGLDFEVAVFGHGAAVTGRAVERFREFAGR